MAYVDYKTSGNKHYFYMKDSGGRKHDGWYCYETTMQGLIPQVWSALPPTQQNTNKKKSNTEIAKEVIAGKWGNGSDRVKKLKKAGYDPAAVQKEVNRLLS